MSTTNAPETFDDTTIKGLDNLHRQGRTARAQLEPIWYMNLAYYSNFQWLAWDGQRLYRPNLRANRITIVDNRIEPAVSVEVAKMTKNDPTFVVVPNTADDEDVQAADLANKIMGGYAWDHLDLSTRTTHALRWSRICGAAFLKTYWDPTVGDKQQVWVGPDGTVVEDAQGAPISPQMDLSATAATLKTIAQGDVRVEVRSPFQMFVDPLADQFDEAEWVIEESIKSAGYVKQRYGVELQPDTAANPGLIEARMGQVFTPGAGGYKGVKVREYWHKPCDDHPNGYRAVWAQKKILFTDEKPFDPCPYIMLSGRPLPGRLWPMSVVELLRGPQTELNKVKSQIAENRNRIGNPTILASKQAVQDPENFTRSISQPGAAYFYDDVGSPNAVPSYLQAPPLPEYVIGEIALIEDSIQEISGQHDVSSAQVPPGVTAASAINLLQEADDTRLGPAMRDYEKQLGNLGCKVLKLIANYYTDARTVQIGGQNGAWQIFDFRGGMMNGNTNVKVQAGSAFPQSAAAKQAAMQDLLTFFVQSGNAPKGRQLAQFLQDWQVGGADKLIEQFTKNETQINRENLQLSLGQPLPINDYDDDDDHIAGHSDMQKSAGYQTLAPQIQQIFEAHVQAHRDREHSQQMTQLQMQMEIEGKTPPMLTAPALQNAQQLSALDPQDEAAAALTMQGAQQGLQMQGQAEQQAQAQAGAQQQQAVQALGAQQQQRHAEETHQQQLRHAEEQHQVRLRAAAQPQVQPQGKAA